MLEFKTTNINNQFEWRFNDGLDHPFAVSNLSNDWHHYAIVYKNNILALTIDGEVAFQNNGIQLNTAEYDIEIGREGFNGQIDEIRFWDVAKNLEDIRKIIHVPSLEREYKGSTHPLATNELVRYIQFNEEGLRPLENVSLRKLKISAPISYVSSSIPMGGPKFGAAETLALGRNQFLHQSTFMTVGSSWVNSDIVVTRIDAKPHNSEVSTVVLPNGDLEPVIQVYDKSYRAIYNHSNTTDGYDLRIAFLDLSVTDDPQQIALLQRSTNGSEDWTFVKLADRISSNSFHVFAHFYDIDAFGQFMTVKLNPPASPRSFEKQEKIRDDLALKVYPNPLSTSSQLNIEINGSEEELQLRIIDNLGRIVKSELLIDRFNTISMAHLSAGKYTCQIIGKDSQQLYQIVIIQ